MSADPEGGIVFTDIVGFTALTDVYGDDVAVDLLGLQDTLVRKHLPSTGRVVKEIGDGLLLWFDDGCDAVATMLTLHESFEQETSRGRPLWVRMGMHWGRPKRRGDDIVGHDVNLASRITDRAGPSEVLCSDAIVAAVDAGKRTELAVEFEPLGPVFVKGVTAPVTLYRVTRPSSPVPIDSAVDAG